MPQGTAMKNNEQSTHTRETKAPRTDTVDNAQGGRSNSLEKNPVFRFPPVDTPEHKFIAAWQKMRRPCN